VTRYLPIKKREALIKDVIQKISQEEGVGEKELRSQATFTGRPKNVPGYIVNTLPKQFHRSKDILPPESNQCLMLRRLCLLLLRGLSPSRCCWRSSPRTPSHEWRFKSAGGFRPKDYAEKKGKKGMLTSNTC